MPRATPGLNAPLENVTDGEPTGHYSQFGDILVHNLDVLTDTAWKKKRRQQWTLVLRGDVTLSPLAKLISHTETPDDSYRY